MLLNDRMVGVFGSVAAGDKEHLVRLAVAAVRAGFGVVPLRGEYRVCTLGVRDSKREHECVHVLTEDTKARAAMNRIIKEGIEDVNLAIDLGESEVGVTDDVSWWKGKPIGPALLMPNGKRLYVFDLKDSGSDAVPSGMITEGLLTMPPSVIGGHPVEMVGQMNYLMDNVEQEDEMASELGPEVGTIWNNDGTNTELALRVESLESTVKELTDTLNALKPGMLAALQGIERLRNGR